MKRSAAILFLIKLLGIWSLGAGAPSENHSHRLTQKPPEKNTPSGANGFPSLLLEGREACVASEISGRKCLLTAEEYNQQVFTLSMISSGAFMQSSARISADSTRFLALKSMLYNLYKERKLQSAGMDSVLDSVTAHACSQDYSRSDTALTKRLPKLYNDRHPSSFRARRIPVFEIIAGSDSAYIHSISGFLKNQDSLYSASVPGDSASRKRARDRIDSLPWRRVALKDLGSVALKAAMALEHFEWSSPIRTPYGFAIVCLADSTWTQEIFFPTVRDSLRLILKAQETAFQDQARSFFRSNKRKYPMPDTLFVKIAVCPDSNCVSNPKPATALPFTSEYLMPASTLKVLKSSNRSRGPDSDWFQTPLGFARLVASEVRRGKGLQPFEAVKWEIFKHIDQSIDSSVLESVKCKQIRRRVADQLVPYIYRDVAALLYQNDLQPGVKTRDPVLRGAIKEAGTRFRGEYAAWMQGLAIEFPER